VKTFFNASQFTPTEWDTAQDKVKFANHFIRFLDSGFKKTLFQKWFYKRLSMTFGHIAHYDQMGFWSEFFESLSGRVRFLEITLQHPCYGSPTHTYCDVERAIQEVVRERKYLEEARAALAAGVEKAERAELTRLKDKYEGANS